MKRIIVMIILLVQIVVVGTALAVPVNLDFTSVPGIDVTTSTTFTLNGVTISYDDGGSGTDFAHVGPSQFTGNSGPELAGIIGDTGGKLIFDFTTSATALNIGFTLLEAVSTTPQVSDALIVLYFYDNGNLLGITTTPADFFASDPTADPTLGLASGILAYSGTAFDHAELFFSTEAASIFAIENMSYEPVPEPGTIVLLAAGLIGLGVLRFKRQRC
ncbi:MAG: PEP-CTERM sorting domain-containing protein [Pedobacter sp.]